MSQTLDAEPPSASAPTTEQGSQSLDDALEGFVPIENWRLRGVVRKLWWIQLALIPVDWALFDRLGAPGLKLVLILTPHVFVSIASLLAYRCLERVRDDVLRALWQRGVIAPRERRADSMRPGSKGDDVRGTRSAPRMRSEAVALIDRSPDVQYTAFIQRLQRRLNRWWPGLGMGLLLGVLFYAFFPSVGFRLGFPLAHPVHVADLHPAVRVLLAIQFLLVVVLGFVAVRLSVLARAVRDLAADFDLRTLRQHPDKCGGLAPLGGLCLSVAAIWGVVAIYPSAWLLMLRAGSFRKTNFFALAHLTPKSNGLLTRVAALQDAMANLAQSGTKAALASKTALLHRALDIALDMESRVTHHALDRLTVYVVVVFVLTFAFAVLTFFVPLYFVHRAMVRQHPKLYAEVAVIGKRIDVFAEATGKAAARMHIPSPKELLVRRIPSRTDGASQEGGHPPKSNEPDQLDTLAKKLDALRDAYGKSSFVPSWPFDVKVFAKFIGATLIPLTGITVWLPSLIGRLVSH